MENTYTSFDEFMKRLHAEDREQAADLASRTFGADADPIWAQVIEQFIRNCNGPDAEHMEVLREFHEFMRGKDLDAILEGVPDRDSMYEVAEHFGYAIYVAGPFNWQSLLAFGCFMERKRKRVSGAKRSNLRRAQKEAAA